MRVRTRVCANPESWTSQRSQEQRGWHILISSSLSPALSRCSTSSLFPFAMCYNTQTQFLSPLQLKCNRPLYSFANSNISHYIKMLTGALVVLRIAYVALRTVNWALDLISAEPIFTVHRREPADSKRCTQLFPCASIWQQRITYKIQSMFYDRYLFWYRSTGTSRCFHEQIIFGLLHNEATFKGMTVAPPPRLNADFRWIVSHLVIWET